MSRYALYPGHIRSQRDGDIHFIGLGQLRKLYRIPADAQVVDATQPGFRAREDDIRCRPRYDGNYPAFSG